MDSRSVFCPYLACPASGRVGKGNIRVRGRKDRRYRCDVCGQKSAATRGTFLSGRRLPGEVIVLIITLLAHGCPRQAIVAGFEIDGRTVRSLEESARKHCTQSLRLHSCQAVARLKLALSAPIHR
jgi:transposase-like protein